MHSPLKKKEKRNMSNHQIGNLQSFNRLVPLIDGCEISPTKTGTDT